MPSDTEPSATPLRRRWKRFLLGATWTVFAAEFFLRIFVPEPRLPRYVEAAEYGIRRNMGDQEYWHRTADYQVHFRTNSKGLLLIGQ